jgi:hypothetical protein
VLVCDTDSSPIRAEQLACAAVFQHCRIPEQREGIWDSVAAAENSKFGNYPGGVYDVLPQLGIRNRKYTQEKLGYFILLLKIQGWKFIREEFD